MQQASYNTTIGSLMSNTSYAKGLIDCILSQNPETSVAISYCWLKGCAILVSFIFVIACIIELYQQFQVYGCRIEWRFFAIVLIALSELVNMAFCVWSNEYILYSTLSYIYSLYFITIVGYVLRLYMRKNSWNSVPRNTYIFISMIVILALMNTAIYVDSLIQKKVVNQSCELIWYLCINVSCLSLCIFALVILFCNHREQRLKMQTMSYDETQIYDPFLSLWLWIGFNTLAQIISLVESWLLIGTSRENDCRIIRDSQIGNNILRFFFAVFTWSAGYAATLIYFRHVRLSNDKGSIITYEKSDSDIEHRSGGFTLELLNNYAEESN